MTVHLAPRTYLLYVSKNNAGGGEGEPRPAATLVLVRDSARGPEVLITIRPEHLRFMGGAAVFPGGAIAPADRHPSWGDVSAAQVCALRETFEEVGLLLADGPVDDLARPLADDPELFRERCLELGVELRSDLLVPAGRWVTPLGSPIRFDTYFFVTRAPSGWKPDPDPAEVAAAEWMTPADALAKLDGGDLFMAPPTIETLQHLAGYTSVDSLTEALLPDPRSDASIERLSVMVHRVVAPNPGLMTGPGTNTYIVGSGPTYVIDPGDPDPNYIDSIASHAPEIDAILVTHRHADHVNGIQALLDRVQVPVRAYGSEPAGGVEVVPIEDEEWIDLGTSRMLALHTPGHARDHLCFYLEGAASLFAGDNILGQGTAVIAPPQGNMKDYLASLRRLQERHISRIYPGHFDPLDGGDQIVAYYLEHRAQRTTAILAALDEGAATIEEIVAIVYTDTPQVLHGVAALQVQAHLELLEQEDRVSLRGNRWMRSGVG